MDAINSDQESDCECDMWDQELSGVFVPSILPSVPIGACHKANQNPQEGSVLQPPVVPSVLNDDCWKHILDYVSLEDIELLEAVNGEWQDMVNRYIQGIRLRIETISSVWVADEQIRRRNCRVLTLRNDPVRFSAVVNRWGASVREIFYDAKDAKEAQLSSIGENCPNLEDITLVRLHWHSSPGWAANFRNLKRVCFENSMILDSCINELFKTNTIEELVIRMSGSFSGRFFVDEEDNNLKKLRTLILSNCRDLDLEPLLSAAESGNLTKVTTLELRYCGWNLSPRLSELLDKLPQLEQLSLDGDVGLGADVAAAVARLPRLQQLGWRGGAVFRGKELDDIRRDTTLLTSRARPRSQGHIQHMNGLQIRLGSARQTAVRRRRRQGYTQRLQGVLHMMLDQRS